MTVPLSLSVIIPCHESEVIGFYEIPGILPNIMRLPGESMRLMIERARQAARGRGAYFLHPITIERASR